MENRLKTDRISIIENIFCGANKMLLTKFYSFEEHHVSAFNNYSAWFSKPSAFNDPFEGNYKLDLSALSEERLKEIIFHDIDNCKSNPFNSMLTETIERHRVSKEDAIKLLSPMLYEDMLKHQEELTLHMSSLIKEVRGAFENSGVCCFLSGETHEALNNPLMWGHYGNGLRGYALGFEHEAGSIFKYPNMAYLFVRYKKAPPTFSPFEIAIRFMSTKSNSLRQELVNQLLSITHTKSTHWRNENELRFLSKEGNSLIQYKEGAVKSLYIGERMNEEQKRTLISIANKHSVENIFIASISNETYDIILKPISR